MLLKDFTKFGPMELGQNSIKGISFFIEEETMKSRIEGLEAGTLKLSNMETSDIEKMGEILKDAGFKVGVFKLGMLPEIIIFS